MVVKEKILGMRNRRKLGNPVAILFYETLKVEFILLKISYVNYDIFVFSVMSN